MLFDQIALCFHGRRTPSGLSTHGHLSRFMVPRSHVLLSFLLACAPQGDKVVSPPSDSGSETGEPVGGVRGRLLLLDGSPVAGATVTVSDQVTVSASDGAFSFDGVGVGEESLAARSDETSDGQMRIQVSADKTTTAILRVLPVSHTTLASAGEGGTVETEDGLRIVFAPEGIEDADGNLVTGPVDIAYALFDTNEEISAAPGNMEAVNSDGTSTPLVSGGMAYVTLSVDGVDVNLSKPAELAFPVNGALSGDEGGLYSFSEGDVGWVEEGRGEEVDGR